MKAHHTEYFEIVYEVVAGIESRRATGTHPKMEEINDKHGSGGFWELAERLSDDFFRTNLFRDWDGEFFDEIDKFLEENLDK